MLAKLSEVLFVEALRRYVAQLPATQSGWLAGLRDPAVGKALACLHRDPARPWTIATLAVEVGLSRSVLAERFRHYLSDTPSDTSRVGGCNWRLSSLRRHPRASLKWRERSAMNPNPLSIARSNESSACHRQDSVASREPRAGQPSPVGTRLASIRGSDHANLHLHP